MRQNRFFLIVTAVLLTGGLAFNTATANTKSLGAGEKAVVTPGSFVTCDSNFMIENIDGTPADLKVVLGERVFIAQMIDPGERLAYSLPATIASARFRGGENLSENEAAMIVNLGPQANLEVSCEAIRRNPLRKKDPLQGFK